MRISKLQQNSGMCLFLCLMFGSMAINAVRVAENENKQLILRHHAGVIFREAQSIQIISEFWHQTYQIKLPVYQSRLQDAAFVCHRTRSAPICELNKRAMSILITAQNKVFDKLVEVKNEIYTLIPDLRSLGIRTKRSAGTAWGLSNAMIAMGGLAHVESDLASVANIQNEQIDAVSKVLTFQQQSIHQHFARLESLIRDAYVELDAMAVVSGQVIDVLGGLTAAEKLINSVRKAVYSGQLDSALISRDIVAETLNNITNVLRESSSDLLPALLLEDVYTQVEYALWRVRNDLFIKVKVPLSHIDREIQLFTVVKFGVSLPASTMHLSTLDTDVVMVGYDQETDTFLEILEHLPSQQGYVYLEQINMRILENQKSCIKSIFQNNITGMQELCNYHILINALIPSVLRLNSSMVLLTAIHNYTMECSGKEENHELHMIQAIIHIPCSCSLITSLIVIPRHYGCLTSNVTAGHLVSHLTNIPYLLEFTSSSSLGGLQMSTNFHHEINIEMPELKLLDANITEALAVVDHTKLKLRETAAKVSRHEINYRHSAEQYAYKLWTFRKKSGSSHTLAGIKSWFSSSFMGFWENLFTNSISISLTTVVAVVALIISCINLCRSCRTGAGILTMPGAALAATISTTPSSRVPKILNLLQVSTTTGTSTGYNATIIATVSSRSEMNLVEYIFDGLTFIVVLGILLLVGCAVWRWKKRSMTGLTSSTANFELLLQIGNSESQINMVWHKFRGNTLSDFNFSSIVPFPIFRIEGKLQKFLGIHWPDLCVMDKTTGKVIILKSKLHLNLLQVRKLNSIFQTQFWSLLMAKSEGTLTKVEVESTAEIKNEAIQPTASLVTEAITGIYPKLPQSSVGSQTELHIPTMG